MSSQKWQTELGYVKKHMNDTFLYSIWRDYKFPNIKLNNKDVELDSNINVYEACFVSLLIEIYLNKYKPFIGDKTLNIIEIGLAYGTSTLTIINKIISSKYKMNYDIIDMNQTVQWNDIGMKNISNFIKHKNTDDNKSKKINIQLFQDSSTIIIPKLRKKYDISFIDGSHAEDIVIQDLMNTHKLLKTNGLIIVDDVLHDGVKKALIRFYDPNIYKIVYINSNKSDFITSKYLYDKNREKRNIFNTNSMLCFQKISDTIPDITPKQKKHYDLYNYVKKQNTKSKNKHYKNKKHTEKRIK